MYIKIIWLIRTSYIGKTRLLSLQLQFLSTQVWPHRMIKENLKETKLCPKQHADEKICTKKIKSKNFRKIAANQSSRICVTNCANDGSLQKLMTWPGSIWSYNTFQSLCPDTSIGHTPASATEASASLHHVCGTLSAVGFVTRH